MPSNLDTRLSTPSPAACSLWESFAIQRRVIGALILRELLTRFGRYNIGFAWMFVEPMMFTVGVTLMWSSRGFFHASTVPVAAFALTGYSCVLLWRNMPGRTNSAIDMNRPLLHHRNVKVIDIFLARLLLEAGGATMSFIILGIIFTTIGWVPPPEDIFKIVSGWVMMGLFGMALAIFIGALSTRSHLVDKIWHPMSYLLFPLSGAAFLVDSLPVSIKPLIMYIPMVHGCECIRDGYFGSRFEAHYDLKYMGMCTTILLLLGLNELRSVTKRVEH